MAPRAQFSFGVDTPNIYPTKKAIVYFFIPLKKIGYITFIPCFLLGF